MRAGVSGDMIKSTAVLKQLFVILCAALILMLLWCNYRSVLWKLIGLYTVYIHTYVYRGQESAAGIATGYGLDGPGIESR